MNRFVTFVLLLCVIYFNEGKAQSGNHEAYKDSLFTSILQSLDHNATDEILTGYMEQLQYYHENPVNINQQGLQGLLQIPFIDLSTVLTIMTIKNAEGPSVTYEKLQDTTLFNQPVISLILPFIVTGFENELPPRRLLAAENPYKGRVNYSLRTPDVVLPSWKKYPGDANYSAGSASIKAENGFFANVAFEKDPGEKSYSDYLSFALRTPAFGVCNSLLLGDYTMDFGEGLLFGGPRLLIANKFQFFSRNTTAKGAEPHTGFNENLFLRGVWAQIDVASFRFEPFLSIKNYDLVPLEADEISDVVLFGSGLHRTPLQDAGRGAIHENSTGLAAHYAVNQGSVSLLFTRIQYDSLVNPLPAKNITGISAAGTYLPGKPITLKGEIASVNSALAQILTGIIDLQEGPQIGVTYYNMSKKFFSVQGGHRGIFSANGNAVNGAHLGVHRTANKKSIGLSIDFASIENDPLDDYHKSNISDFTIYWRKEIKANTAMQLTGNYRQLSKSSSHQLFSDYTINSWSAAFDAAFALSRFVRSDMRIKYGGSQIQDAVSGNTNIFFSFGLKAQLFHIFQLRGKFSAASSTNVVDQFTDYDYYEAGEYAAFSMYESYRYLLMLTAHPAPGITAGIYLNTKKSLSVNAEAFQKMYGLTVRMVL